MNLTHQRLFVVEVHEIYGPSSRTITRAEDDSMVLSTIGDNNIHNPREVGKSHEKSLTT